MSQLDVRLLTGGLAIPIATRAAMFEEHWPGGMPREVELRQSSCPACGHNLDDIRPECPSLVLARQALARNGRYREDMDAVPAWIVLALKRPPKTVPEPRGRRFHLAGLCVACGKSTIHRSVDGMPRHRLITQRRTGSCSACGELMTIYASNQRMHPSCAETPIRRAS